ncbi:MAG: hypothetical protein LBC43_01405 [Bifidobacteriaceae bacterium]|jgi:uncharacterized membrane protein YkvI|nr:hypothetical protein [Bifidobacteriaceae bacterium]
MADKGQTTWQRYVYPGLIFQSVIIGGGYGTGKELAEYFFGFGPVWGLLAMCISTFGIWAIVCSVTFEFCRIFRTWDYKSMMQKLLGRGWVYFEICYLILLTIVLAVVVASAASNATEVFGLPGWVGIVILSAGILFLALIPTEKMERHFALWSYVLYAVYALFLILTFVNLSSEIWGNFTNADLVSVRPDESWFVSGAQYAFYNLGIIPAIIFSTRHQKSRKEAVGSGLIASFIGILPGLFLYIGMVSNYSEILADPDTLPVNLVFEKLGMQWMQIAFVLTLVGTLMETGSAFIKAVTDRVQTAFLVNKWEFPIWLKPALAVGLMGLGVFISQFGLTGLIAQGYGTISWGFLLVYVLPMAVFGTYDIIKQKVPIKLDKSETIYAEALDSVEGFDSSDLVK